ncbi:MAG: RlmE family RNA methyltransferase [Hyphomicrobiales bacterium]
MAKKSSGPSKGSRELHIRVKTAKGRRLSSKLWLQRQLNDPYVVKAKKEGYRSRATFKLSEINEKYHLLKKDMHIVDLGCAPGGWLQYASNKIGIDKGHGSLIGIDLQEVEPVSGCTVIQGDFLEEEMMDKLKELIPNGRVDMVMSDMAASSTGHKQTDHLRIIGLCEAALWFARQVLNPEGIFLAKVLQGGAEREILNDLRKDFKVVRHVKPNASRKDSSEMFVLATGFRGEN